MKHEDNDEAFNMLKSFGMTLKKVWSRKKKGVKKLLVDKGRSPKFMYMEMKPQIVELFILKKNLVEVSSKQII